MINNCNISYLKLLIVVYIVTNFGSVTHCTTATAAITAINGPNRVWGSSRSYLGSCHGISSSHRWIACYCFSSCLGIQKTPLPQKEFATPRQHCAHFPDYANLEAHSVELHILWIRVFFELWVCPMQNNMWGLTQWKGSQCVSCYCNTIYRVSHIPQMLSCPQLIRSDHRLYLQILSLLCKWLFLTPTITSKSWVVSLPSWLRYVPPCSRTKRDLGSMAAGCWKVVVLIMMKPVEEKLWGWSAQLSVVLAK